MASPAAPAPTVGPIVAGKYHVEERLGGTNVYRAVQIVLDRQVALKVYASLDQETRTRFLKEAQIAATLRHPGIVEVFDAAATPEGGAYCAMELLTGETLAERIARSGKLDPPSAVAIAASVCSALSAMHGKGILHRDVSPDNVFLASREDGGEDPKLIDFGAAKRTIIDANAAARITARMASKKARHTVAGDILGTPRYASPELVEGRKLDARSDVYSLAATLYEALAGAPPFDGDTGDLVPKILTETPRPIAERAPDAGVPEALDQAILRALAKDPEERHESAAKLANALWAALADARGDRPPVARESAAPATPLAAPPWRSIAAAVALVAAIVAILLLLRASPRDGAHAAQSASAPPASAPAASSSERAEASAPAATATQNAPRLAQPRSRSTTPAATQTSYKLDDLKTPY